MKTYMDILHDRRKALQNPYAFADELADFEERKRDRLRLENPYAHIDEISRGAQRVQRFDGIAQTALGSRVPTQSVRRTDLELEDFVREVQLHLWNRRVELFGLGINNPIAVLDPAVALQVYGYQVNDLDSLGQFATAEGIVEVAGVIDKRRKLVEVSRQFPRNVRSFTVAHELGHALLHETSGLHRDRALDGSSSVKDPNEREANRFATLFLMPAKQVRRVFEEIFGLAPVRFDELATFGRRLPKRASVRRMAARRLASLVHYNGAPVISLAERFNVSVETMAIRLEELNLFLLSNNLPGQRK